jgi:hypothetical protein
VFTVVVELTALGMGKDLAGITGGGSAPMMYDMDGGGVVYAKPRFPDPSAEIGVLDIEEKILIETTQFLKK